MWYYSFYVIVLAHFSFFALSPSSIVTSMHASNIDEWVMSIINHVGGWVHIFTINPISNCTLNMAKGPTLLYCTKFGAKDEALVFYSTVLYAVLLIDWTPRTSFFSENMPFFDFSRCDTEALYDDNKLINHQSINNWQFSKNEKQ